MRTEIENIVTKILVSLDLIEKRYDLNKCRDKVEELNAISEQNDFWNDNEFAQKIMKERQSLITNIETCQDFRRTLDDTIELIDLAESENKSDLIGGIDLENVEKDVSDILIDLSRRETKNSSIEFAELFVLTFEKNDIKLLRRPHRQAGFAVLKAPDIPSVLIEMGFISNNSDLKKLSNNEYLKKLMHQVSLVVEKYFIDNPQ